MNKTGQGSLEYLLLIGGVVLIAAVVLSLLSGLGTAGQNQALESGSTVEAGFSDLENIVYGGLLQNGEFCNDDSECISGYCESNSCEIPPGTCIDGIKNQDETDIDCGGTICQQCNNGETCLINADCVSLDCNTGGTDTCQNLSATCGNGTIELGEDCDNSDVGGQTCMGIGYGSGSLACENPTCLFNVAPCVPDSAQNFVATAIGSDVNLTWDNPLGAANITIRRGGSSGYPTTIISGVFICNVSFPENSCLNTGVPENSFYYSAFVQDLEGQTSQTAYYPVTVDNVPFDGQNYRPLSPMFFQQRGFGSDVNHFVELTPGEVTINWESFCFEDDPAEVNNACASNDITSYKIYYKRNSSANNLAEYTTIFSVLPANCTNNCSITLTGLQSGTIHYYYIVAIDTGSRESTTIDLGLQKFFTPN